MQYVLFMFVCVLTAIIFYNTGKQATINEFRSILDESSYSLYCETIKSKMLSTFDDHCPTTE